MILPDLVLPSRVNQHWQYSGMDSPDLCLDKKHFNSYPYTISYLYNSRGYRDQEWPTQLNQLKDAVWCIGDSFTVGLGSPVEHTWPYILQQQTGQRTINVSMDGASNNWIARCVNLVQKEIHPKNIIVMWSYVHRREHENQNLSSEQRRLHFDKSDNLEDMRNLESCRAMIAHSKIIQLAIPGYAPIIENYQSAWQNLRGVDWPELVPGTADELLALPKFVQTKLQKSKLWTDLQQSMERQLLQSKLENNFIKVNRLDLARDAWHFDLMTSQWVVDQIMPRLT
jgi:hypothetical protein